LDFELLTISNSGYPGYFLIVQDLIAEARSMGVSVGPGRGSAAGSVVAYCLKITIDPIDVQPAFERFLNPIVCHYPILISILMMKAEAV
jgi:DNA polymerase-3 subunit alpha